MNKKIDLRSDTVTHPTEAMRAAMAHAVVGDDVYGDDTTTIELESLAAQMLKKEAALFVPSGTFGNQLALLTHCDRGDEVILPEDCHIVAHEAGAAGLLSGVQLRTIEAPHGVLDPESVEKRIRKEQDIHFPKTALIVLETAFSDGTVPPLENLQAVARVAKKYDVNIHMDGARLFNAAQALGVDASELTRDASSVMFCLSKGLCAPIGSILVGTKPFIERARIFRKKMGGGMRQTGILAAAGILALTEMTKRLHEDHDNARLLADGLAQIDGVTIAIPVQINMVFFDADKALQRIGMTHGQFTEKLQSQGFLVNGIHDGLFRFVTHNGITWEHVHTVLQAVRSILGA